MGAFIAETGGRALEFVWLAFLTIVTTGVVVGLFIGAAALGCWLHALLLGGKEG